MGGGGTKVASFGTHFLVHGESRVLLSSLGETSKSKKYDVVKNHNRLGLRYQLVHSCQVKNGYSNEETLHALSMGKYFI